MNRQDVYSKYDGHCAYCGCVLEFKNMQIDHLEPLDRDLHTNKPLYPERDNYDNMMPSCRSCNNYKHSYSLETFRNNIDRLLIQLERISIFRIAKRFGLIRINLWNRKFYFESTKEKE